jgi:hypothetical protein
MQVTALWAVAAELPGVDAVLVVIVRPASNLTLNHTHSFLLWQHRRIWKLKNSDIV